MQIATEQTQQGRRKQAKQMELMTALPCPILGCTGVLAQRSDTFCAACWARLPEGVQFHLPKLLSRQPNGGETQQLLAHARARLEAERQGPLFEEELARADQLTRYCTAFSSFAEMLNALDDYFPKLSCSFRDAPNATIRSANSQLADYYDRAQAARGDVRRACRGVGCGL